jgi:hypothetical protein
MVKFEIVVLTGRENTDVIDANVAVGWMIYITARVLVIEREKTDMM